MPATAIRTTRLTGTTVDKVPTYRCSFVLKLNYISDNESK